MSPVNLLTVAAYSALKFASLATMIITAPRCAINISAGSVACRLFFGSG